ncbi:MAG: hypothetical protein ACLUD2_03190 [Clostridium sp.]
MRDVLSGRRQAGMDCPGRLETGDPPEEGMTKMATYLAVKGSWFDIPMGALQSKHWKIYRTELEE